MSLSDYPSSVEEFQGVYGPYQVSELLLQKIWLEGSFDDRKMIDSSGREILVKFPGRWNRLDGPDFKDAILYIDGEYCEGDVEVHFACKDWFAHGHDSNPNYDRVILHVLYHPVLKGDAEVLTSENVAIPAISLMERLWYDLEEYANIDSLIQSTGMGIGESLGDLLALSLDERVVELTEAAKERWKAKLGFAALRIEKLGWVDACHQTAMEIMGYRFNRAAMLRVAGTYDFQRFASKSLSGEMLWEAGGDKWKQRGCRPANQPKARLQQYLSWVENVSDWPLVLQSFSFPNPSGGSVGAASRKSLEIKNLKNWLSEHVFASQIGGTRFDTMVCDGFLPLLAAQSENDYFPIWFHWYLGDLPDVCLENLKLLQVAGTRSQPLGNGWGQGILQKVGFGR